jgi:Cu/Ag efflux pump CusA
MLVGIGLYSLKNTPVDALPDLSDVQVIIKTAYPGQAPQVVEDQVTYPLTTAMLSVPGAVTVRGYSFFGDSFVYVIFDEKTDLYWARSRVLEYLSQVAPSLLANARPQLGPDATGVGWVYLYALVDKTGKHDISQLRSLQDWFLKYELQTVPGVSEVAAVGGMIKQYQVKVNPNKLRAFGIPLSKIHMAIKAGNQEIGASVVEMAEAEYMVRATGYLQSVKNLGNIPLGVTENGIPLLLKDVAEIGTGPQIRRGVVDLNGEGETVGGIIIMRFGENAQTTIDGVKAKLEELKAGLPEGVEIIPVYDRSALIERAVTNLWHKLLEEFAVVALVCVVFLFHVRSSLVAIISLPVGILIAFIVMHLQGLNANIMSLGDIKVDIQREKAARYGLNIADVQQVVASAIGGMNVTQTVEGLERYPVNLRYPQDYRNSPEQLSLLPIVTMTGQRITLADVANIYVEDGPPAIKSENARLNGWSFIDIEGVDIGSYVVAAQKVVAENIELPTGYSLNWSGQYEYMMRAKAKLTYVVPLTLTIIIILLYMNFRNFVEVTIIIGTLPLAMVGSIWLMYLEGYNFSVAVGVGFIALAGVTVEIGVIMLVYLNQAYNKMLADSKNEGISAGPEELSQAVLHGAGMRVRPIMMTAAAIIAGLLPILLGTGTGSEVMSRIAAPMIGGMVSSVILALLVIPAVFFLWRKGSL